MQKERSDARRGLRRAAPKRAAAAHARQTAEVETVAGGRVPLGHLDKVLGFVLRQAQIAVFKDFRRTFADMEITPTQYAVLSLISDNPGLKQGDISNALGIKRTNFVAVLDELERRGLAKRHAMADDRRSRALNLTEAGEALTARIRAINAEHEARLTALLPAGQQPVLIELLRRLSEGLATQASED